MFLSRNTNITLWKSKGALLAKANAMNKSEVNTFIQESASVLSNTSNAQALNNTSADEDDKDGCISSRSSEPRKDTSCSP